VGLLLGVGRLSAEAVPPSENLLPDSTKGFVAVASMDRLSQSWNKTQLGQLMADPVMKPFKEDFRRQLQERLSGLNVRLGLTLDDLKGVPGGEVAVAVILPAPDQAALAIVVDVTGHLDQANELLEKVTKNLTQRGAKRTEQKAAGTTIVQFDVPAPKNDLHGKPGKAFYFLSGNLLVTSDDLQVVTGILARTLRSQKDSLADLPAFKAVINRCAEDAGGTTPQVRWFIHPLGYVEAIRAATPERRRKGKSILEILENQGFGAIQGVGGFVDFAAEGYELVHRTAVYAPPPYKKSMKILLFPNGRQLASGQWVPNDFTPQNWVPRDIATYTTLYCDILNAFDNFGPLFDELFGGEAFLFHVGLKHQDDLAKGVLPKELRQEFEKLRIPLSSRVTITTRKAGSVWKIFDNKQIYVVRKRNGVLRIYQELTGIWEDTVESLWKDPNGPKYHLRNELVVHLGQRVTVISDYELPITPASERLLFAIEAKNVEKLRATIAKAMKAEASVKRRVFGDHIIWEVVEEEQPEIPELDIPPLPGVDPDDGHDDHEQEDARLLPKRALAVANGHLFVASHIDFLKKVLKEKQPRETLGGSLDYLLVDSQTQKLGIKEKCTRMFSRTDEEYRPTYELIKQGKMPLSETLLGRLLNTLLGEGKKGVVRPQRIEGQKLPDYEVVRRSLGPAGLVVTSEYDKLTKHPTGWFFKGFTLKKP